MAETIRRERCPQCTKNGRDIKGNNLSFFLGDNGNELVKCMNPTCTYNQQQPTTHKNEGFLNLDTLYCYYDDIIERRISKQTCQLCEYQLCKDKETDTEIVAHKAIHRNSNNTTSNKFRLLPKSFVWKPSQKDTSMYCLDKCNNFNKPLCIVEGDIDCLTLWENGYQTCSLTSAGSETALITLDLKKINKFPEIWLCGDSPSIDAAGQQVFNNIKELLSHKLLRYVDFAPYKDANEAYCTDRAKFKELMHSPVEIIPNGVIFGNQLQFSSLWETPKPGIDLPWPRLNDMIKGLHKGMFYMLFGGSSIGKSSILRELVYYLRINKPEIKIANLFLEEEQIVNPLSFVALHKNIPIGELLINREFIPVRERAELEQTLLNTENLMFTDAQYDLDATELLKTIEYLAKVKHYDIIVLDHISMVIAATQSKEGERRDIDILMKNLLKLCKETGIIIISACHLTDPDSRQNWDEGAIPSLYNGRGSRALAQKPDFVIGISRNMKNPHSCDILKFHVLKNRWFSKLGDADELMYMTKTGRLRLK